MKDEIDEAMAQLDNALDAVVRAAEHEAQSICEPFLDLALELRRTKRPKDWFKYTIHIRGQESPTGKYSLRIDWAEIVWMPVASGDSEKNWRFRTRHVGRTSTGKYSIRKFGKAGPEEKSLIMETMSQLEKVEDALKLVGSMKKSKSNVMRKYKER